MRKTLLITGLLSTLAMSLFAREGQWTEGFGQGNLEYFIDKGDYRLYIGCPTQDGMADAPSGVDLTKISSGTRVKRFTVTVNGITYDGPFETDSRVGDSNFLSFLENVRKSDAVVKFDNKRIVFPKSNAGKVVPMYGSKHFRCNTFF